MDRKGMTIRKLRQNLKIECLENYQRCKLKDLCDGTIQSGRFRILCIIKDIETENFIKGHCRKCRKIVTLWKYENSGINKCQECNESMEIHMMIKITVYDQHKYEATLYMKNLELLKCLGFSSPSLKCDILESEMLRKTACLRDKIAEFGIVKYLKRKPLMIYNSVWKNNN